VMPSKLEYDATCELYAAACQVLPYYLPSLP
jgi:hypothetical protein